MATTTALVSRAQMLPAPMNQMLQALMPDIKTLLPPDVPYEQFRAALWLELTGRPQLKDCSPESIRDAAVKCATYGMLPGRDAHILPFRNKRKGGRSEGTYVVNYFGVLLGLERTGKVRKAFAHAVREKDEFVFDFFTEQFSHVPAMVKGLEPGKALFYYGAIQTTDGAWHVEPMTLQEIDAVRRSAPAHDDGPWVSHFDQMARKTAMKACAKYLRLTPQLKAILEEDDQRQLEDIPPERHAKNLADLYEERPDATAPQAEAPAPEPPPDSDQPGKRGGQTVKTAIEDLHRAAGKDEWAIVNYWGRICREKGVQAPEDLPLSLLSKLLGDVRRFYSGQEGEASTRSPEEKAAPEATPAADDPPMARGDAHATD